MFTAAWKTVVPLVAIAIALLVFWQFAYDLHVTDRERTVYHAAIFGVALVGAVKVLLRFNPGELRGNNATSALPKREQPPRKEDR